MFDLSVGGQMTWQPTSRTFGRRAAHCQMANGIIMRSRRRSGAKRSHDVSPILMVSCAHVPVRKIPELLAHMMAILYLIVLSSRVWLCGCIDVGPSNATERAWISAARAAVEAPI